ncbi:hypothetical protein ACLKA7_002367 [Drosophila subpalustris]
MDRRTHKFALRRIFQLSFLLFCQFLRMPQKETPPINVCISAAAATATNNFDIALAEHCEASPECSGQDVQGYCEINVMAEH